MSSYGSARSGQLHPGYQAQPQQQRARSYSNPPFPTPPGSAPYPQQQSSYFPPPPTAPYQQAPPTSNPIAIPAVNRKRAASDYAHDYGTSPSHQQSASPYASSFPTQYLQPIPQQPPIPEDDRYPPQQRPIRPCSPGYSHHRHSSPSHHGYNPRHSYDSAHSFQSAQSHHAYPSPDLYARNPHNGHGNHDDRYNYGNENEAYGHVHTTHGSQALQAHAAPEPSKGYGDWDKDEVERYKKNQDLERRPTLGGSLISFVKKIGGSDRR